jgi:hypothetical protein
MIHPKIKDSLGSLALLSLPKTAFLCSRKVPAGIILKCYDWAIAQREAGNCVIGGFHSTIEKDVLHYLLSGKQPVIIALARSIGPQIGREFDEQIESERLLIISPFDRRQSRADKRSAAIRNNLMIELADNLVVGHASPNGELSRVLNRCEKAISFL